MPDAELLDVNCEPVTLARMRGGRPAVVVLYRGAWCPYCNIALRTYQAELVPALDERGVALIAVSPQKPDGSMSSVEVNELTFAVASDPGNQLAVALGVETRPSADAVAVQMNFGLDLSERNADGRTNLPMPTVVVVDGAGVIRWIDVHPNYATRSEVPDILAAVDAMEPNPCPATRFSSPAPMPGSARTPHASWRCATASAPSSWPAATRPRHGRREADLQRITNKSVFEILIMDTSDLTSVRAAVKAIDRPLRAVLLNAGGMGGATPFARTADGVTTMFAVNVLGHVVLLEGLLSAGLLTSTAVLTGSEAARGVPKMRIKRPTFSTHSVNEFTSVIDGSFFDGRKRDPMLAYGQAKYLGALWMSALARQHPELRLLTVSPGNTTGTDAPNGNCPPCSG